MIIPGEWSRPTVQLEIENAKLRAEIERLNEDREKYFLDNLGLRADNERQRAVIVRAKDALIDGQSTQWVHDLLVAALLEPKP